MILREGLRNSLSLMPSISNQLIRRVLFKESSFGAASVTLSLENVSLS
jgi:hypothetical protein